MFSLRTAIAATLLCLFPISTLGWTCTSPLPPTTATSTATRQMFGRLSRLSTQQVRRRTNFIAPSSVGTSTRLFMSSDARKPGVASPEELREFVETAGDKLMVVDVRNPDAAVEPGDQKSLVVAAVPSEGVRPQGVHLIWDRNTDSMPFPDTEDKTTPIITHCGGGGRGQKAKDFLEENGFTNVLNGGGPKETDCWAEFGGK